MVRGIKKNQLKSIDVNDMHENLLLIRYSVSTVLAKKKLLILWKLTDVRLKELTTKI